MPGNNGRRASAKANTRSGVGAPSPTPPPRHGASLSSSSMVTATGPSSSSSSFLELRHLQALRRSLCGSRAPARRAVRRRAGRWWRVAWRTKGGGEAHPTASYRPKAAYE